MYVMKLMTRLQSIPGECIYLILCYTVKLDFSCSSFNFPRLKKQLLQPMLPNAKQLTYFVLVYFFFARVRASRAAIQSSARLCSSSTKIINLNGRWLIKVKPDTCRKYDYLKMYLLESISSFLDELSRHPTHYEPQP